MQVLTANAATIMDRLHEAKCREDDLERELVIRTYRGDHRRAFITRQLLSQAKARVREIEAEHRMD